MSATPDDSVFCNLCEPPHETSVAMFTAHLQRVHGWTDEQIGEMLTAPVYDSTDPREDGAA